MGVTKTEIFTDQQNRIARFAKVLGHPARIAILQHLLSVKECICGDLVEVVGLSQPTISQHLRELKDVGLLKGNIDGVRVCYCIDPDTYSEIREALTGLLSRDVASPDCC